MSQKRTSKSPPVTRNTRSRLQAPEEVMEEDPVYDTGINQTHHLSQGMPSVVIDAPESNDPVDLFMQSPRPIKYSDLTNCFNSLRSMYGINLQEFLGIHQPSDYCGRDDIIRIMMLVGHKAESKARMGEIATVKSSMTTVLRATEDLRRNVTDLGSAQTQIIAKLESSPTLPTIMPITTATIPAPTIINGVLTMIRFLHVSNVTGTKYGEFLGSVYHKIRANPTEFAQWLARLSDNMDKTEFLKSASIIRAKYDDKRQIQ